jgi:branched-chain amino acid transport system substrate-binding protein
VGGNPDLRARVTGTIPGTSNKQFAAFVSNYNFQYPADQVTDFPANTFGAAGGYDAVFLLAYATATLNGKPETGKNLAEGLKLLSNLDPLALTVDAGVKNLSAGITELISKGSINYNGASGPLNFDPKTGEAQSDIQIWCLPTLGMTTGDGRPSGLFYDAAATKLAGTFTACN